MFLIPYIQYLGRKKIYGADAQLVNIGAIYIDVCLSFGMNLHGTVVHLSLYAVESLAF